MLELVVLFKKPWGVSPSLENDMYYVYVLKSKADGKLYIGYSSDLKKRLTEHSKRGVKSTKSRGSFDLIYYEAYAASQDAKNREKQLKRFSGSYTHLKKRVKNSLESFSSEGR